MAFQRHHNNELLQAVLAHPEMDSHRLRYAEWLEKHGDPNRAELIRVQIALANPTEWDDPQLSELERRERELLTAHAKEWLGFDLGGSSDWKAIYRRGFVEELVLECPWSRAFDAISAQHPVTTLCLLGRCTSLELSRMAGDLANCRGLALVSKITDYSRIDEEPQSTVEMPTKVRSYWKRDGAVLSRLLSSVYLPERLNLFPAEAWRDKDRDELLRHPRLGSATGLAIRNSCRDGVLLKWLQRCKNLSELRIFAELTEWGRACAYDLFESELWKQLKKLEYIATFSYHLPAQTYDFPWLHALRRSKLEDLTIASGNIMETATGVSSIWDAFAAMEPLENLKHLSMYQVPLSPEFVEQFINKGHASQLHSLRLHDRDGFRGNLPPEVLLKSPCSPNLHTLGVSLSIDWRSARISIAKRFAKSPLFESTRHLDLWGGNISIESMRALAAYGFFRNLRTFVFPNNSFRFKSEEEMNDYVDLIATSDGFQNLHSLRLPSDLMFNESNLDLLMKLLESPNLPNLTALELNIGCLDSESRESLIRFVENRSRPIWICGLVQHPWERGGMLMPLFASEDYVEEPIPVLDDNWGELDQFMELWQTDFGLQVY